MPEENEAMLLVILNAFSDAVSMLLRYRIALADGLLFTFLILELV